MPFIAFVLFGIPLPLTIMQILAVDLGTDLLPALALGTEAPESDVMTRPPRRRSERLLNLSTLLRAYGWLGLLEAALSLSGYFFVFWLAGWHPGMPLAGSGPLYVTATTMTLAGIVACQAGNVFACRSRSESIWHLGFWTNRLLLGGVAAELILLLVLIYSPPLQTVFGLAPLASWHWLLLLTFGPVLLFLEEGRKAVIRRSSPFRFGRSLVPTAPWFGTGRFTEKKNSVERVGNQILYESRGSTNDLGNHEARHDCDSFSEVIGNERTTTS